MEAVGINIGYLIIQVCIIMVLPVVLLVGVIYLIYKKGLPLGAETIKTIEVTEQGATIPKELLEGVKRLEIKRKQDILYLVAAKEDFENSG